MICLSIFESLQHTLHRANGFLADFDEWLQELGFSTWTIDKEPGNRLTNHWLRTCMDSSAPTKSQVQFGCTTFASVNPRIHAYARTKGQHLSAAVVLLQNFVEQVWSFRVSEEQTPAVEPSPAPQRDDGWQALDLRQYQCPSSEKVWFSDESSSVWFVPDDSGVGSTYGTWQKYQHEAVGGVSCCNESSLQLYFPSAA